MVLGGGWVGWVRDLVCVMEAVGGLLSRAETCSCTLGSNVNTPVLSNKQVVLD